MPELPEVETTLRGIAPHLTGARIARLLVRERRLAYFGSLDGFPSLDSDCDLPLPPIQCLDGGTIFSQEAQAYVQAVSLAEVDAAQSLLPPGGSESPDDPFYAVNVEGWVRGQLHPAPLSRSAVEPCVVSRQQLLGSD